MDTFSLSELIYVACYIISVEDIANFLIESYGNSSTTVVIYEADEPNYVIAIYRAVELAICVA
jgi:hypothetical protein